MRCIVNDLSMKGLAFLNLLQNVGGRWIFAHTRKQRLNEYLSGCFIKAVLMLVEDTLWQTGSLLTIKFSENQGILVFIRVVSSVGAVATQP